MIGPLAVKYRSYENWKAQLCARESPDPWLKWVWLILASATVGLGITPTASAQSVLQFPRVLSSPDVSTTIGLTNPTPVPALVTLTAYVADGTLWTGTGIQNPVTVTLPAGGQVNQRAADWFSSAGTFNGWVRATSPSTGLSGAFRNVNAAGTELDGAVSGGPRREMVLPFVADVEGAVTEITIVNVDDALAHADLTLRAQDGGVLGNLTLEIAPRALVRQRIDVLFPEISLVNASHIGVRSDRSVLGYEVVVDYRVSEGDIARESLAARGRAVAAGPSYVLPQFATGGGWFSLFGLVNTTGVAQDVTITAYDDDGEMWGLDENPRRIRLEANAALRTTLSDLFGFDEAVLQTGWLQLEASVGYLAPFSRFRTDRSSVFRLCGRGGSRPGGNLSNQFADSGRQRIHEPDLRESGHDSSHPRADRHADRRHHSGRDHFRTSAPTAIQRAAPRTGASGSPTGGGLGVSARHPAGHSISNHGNRQRISTWRYRDSRRGRWRLSGSNSGHRSHHGNGARQRFPRERRDRPS